MPSLQSTPQSGTLLDSSEELDDFDGIYKVWFANPGSSASPLSTHVDVVVAGNAMEETAAALSDDMETTGAHTHTSSDSITVAPQSLNAGFFYPRDPAVEELCAPSPERVNHFGPQPRSTVSGTWTTSETTTHGLNTGAASSSSNAAAQAQKFSNGRSRGPNVPASSSATSSDRDVQGDSTHTHQHQSHSPTLVQPPEIAIAIRPCRAKAVRARHAIRFPATDLAVAAANGKGICPTCRMAVGRSEDAMNSHNRRFHNKWADNLGAEWPCWLCAASVQTDPSAYNRHRQGDQRCTQCPLVVELEGKIARLGDWVVRADPEVVELKFDYWQFGDKFSGKLRAWWAWEMHQQGATWRWWQAWKATVAGAGGQAVPRGGPAWQRTV